ncbi:hypothetical protein BH23BAC1_BH23BAC1_01000 [soil metagenome]
MRILWKKFLKNLKPISLLVLFAIILSGCDLFIRKSANGNSDNGPKAVARVHNHYLYSTDLEGLMRKNISKSDSASLAERYIQSWIKKQLLVNEAASRSDFDKEALEAKVINYRYDLMIHELEKNFIDRELNTDVTEEEINKYYKENLENFELKQNIIKCIYLKIPNDAPKVQRVKKLVHSTNSKEKDELKSYAYRFSPSYSLQDSVWMNFEEIIAHTPFAGFSNKVQFLKGNSYSEMKDDDYTYFLKIYDYKISDQTSPLEFVKDQITNIIINKRKKALAEKLEDQIYSKAVNDKDFEIFKK